MVKRKLGIHGIVRGDASYTYEIGKDLYLETGHSDHASAFYMYATQAAEVMVDEESGRVRLLRMSAAHDVGKAINPLNCIAQIEGGVAMGIGSTLHEETIIIATGKVRNPSFLDYHLVTSLDVPKMIPIIVECAEPEGPYGAKVSANLVWHRLRRRSAMLSPMPSACAFMTCRSNPKMFFGRSKKIRKKPPLSRPTSNFDDFSSNIRPSVEPQSSTDGEGFVGGQVHAACQIQVPA